MNLSNPFNLDDPTTEANDLLVKLANTCPSCKATLNEVKGQSFKTIKCPKCKLLIKVTTCQNQLKDNFIFLGLGLLMIGIILGALLS